MELALLVYKELAAAEEEMAKAKNKRIEVKSIEQVFVGYHQSGQVSAKNKK